MAVYTPIDEDAARGLLARYDIGDLTQLEGITQGVENTNYRLGTTKGEFVLTLYEKRVAREDLPFFIGLMEHLAEGGIAAPRPVHDNDGAVLQEVAGKPAAIVTFLDGVSRKSPAHEQYHPAGEALAKLHLAAGDFTMTRKNALGHDGWKNVFDNCMQSGGESLQPDVMDDIRKKLENIINDWPRDLPQGAIHADFFPDNVLFMGNNVTGVIDFYFACNDFLAYDLAITLNAWCFDAYGEFDFVKSRKMIAGYQSIRKLDAREVAAMPVLCRGAAMRFYLTRLYDIFNTPKDAQVLPHNPDEYLRRINAHHQIRKPELYGF